MDEVKSHNEEESSLEAESNIDATETPAGADESTLISNRRDFLRTVAAASAAGIILPQWMEAAQAAKIRHSTNPAPKAMVPGKPQLGKTNAAKSKDPLRPSKAVENEVKEGAKVEGAMRKNQKRPAAAQRVNVAIIGAGSQGRNLILNTLKIPGIHFVAVCDIWGYAQQYGAGIIKTKQSKPRAYTDYHDMLEKEPSIQAVIIATPDWLHSPITVDCLKAGKHVYCEKEMSNTLEGARKMVEAARETGKLLQIGHQRRSNPRYLHTLELIHKEKIIGSITHTYGQWNRPKRLELGWPKGREMSQANLERFGYDTMERFRNWRWYRQYSGGAIADLGSHQIDIFSWFLRANPIAVMAGGGNDYYKKGEWYDHVMAIYEYDANPNTNDKSVRGHKVRSMYQVLNTSGWGGYYEVFMGDQGVIEISEDTKKGFIVRAPGAPPKKWIDEASKVDKEGMSAVQLYVGETLKAAGRPKEEALAKASEKAPHQLHLENFFSAITKGTPLSCPPEVGYETCVAVLKANDAVAAQKRLEFDAGDFKI